MALTKLHTNWINGSYTADRDAQIKKLENAPLANDKTTNLNAHADTVGNSIAVGYGYDLKKNLKTLKTDLAGYVTASSDLDKVYDLVNNYFNNGNPKGYTLPELATAINQYFDFGTEANAAELLSNRVAAVYESRVDSWLGYHMDPSRERAALVSLSYNGGLGINLKNAILNDNRAEAWFEIRYNSNAGSSAGAGIAKRRFLESEFLSLYNDPNNVSADEEVRYAA